MATEIRVPKIGVSAAKASIGRWFKRVGDAVSIDEPLVEIETDGTTVEVTAPATGVGPVAELVGIEVGVVSGVMNLESSGVEASDWRLRHDQGYHEA